MYDICANYARVGCDIGCTVVADGAKGFRFTVSIKDCDAKGSMVFEAMTAKRSKVGIKLAVL